MSRVAASGEPRSGELPRLTEDIRGPRDQKGEKYFSQVGNFFCFPSFPLLHFPFPLLRFHFSLRLRSREGQAGPLNVRRRMRLGHHCRAPPLAVQPSPAPTIRHGGGARRVGAGARRWADLQASVTSTGPVCGQTNPGEAGEKSWSEPPSRPTRASSTSPQPQYGKLWPNSCRCWPPLACSF